MLQNLIKNLCDWFPLLKKDSIAGFSLWIVLYFQEQLI